MGGAAEDLAGAQGAILAAEDLAGLAEAVVEAVGRREAGNLRTR